MKSEIEDRIIKYINKQVEYDNTKYLNICWMGGEPLLNYNTIRNLTEKIKKIKIKFSADLITNGYLLTEEKIKELEELKIKFVQVTLDGTEEEHNKTRIHKTKEKTFSNIIKNIETFFKYYSEKDVVNLNIRVNVIRTEDYLEKFINIYDYLRNKFPYSNLNITPGFVEDITKDGNKCTCDFDRNVVNKFYIEISQKIKLKEYSPYPKFTSECSVRSNNTSIIGPNAELYSCWDYIGNKSKEIGLIDKDGNKKITDDNTYVKYLVGADYLDEKECIDCFFFPVCNGGCPEKRIKNKYENTNFDCCCIQKDNIEEVLDSHYDLFLFHQKNG